MAVDYICPIMYRINSTVTSALIGISLLFLALSACKKDKFLTDASAKLQFSTSSILFDTVFTTVGSTTRLFTVYNKHSQPIRISNIWIARSTASNFRINVDGVAGTAFKDVEIAANDSLFVFAEVTVDPNKTNNPLIIRDSIVFETNGNTQDVDLEAWGQDAYFHTPTVFPINGLPPYSVITCNSTWTSDKPHVIYGFAVVDSACTLTISQGARIYMHPGAVLWVYKGGTLKVNETGTLQTPVTFQGDRLEPEYADAAGQWGYIWLSRGSKNNVINGSIIKNGTVGIIVDTLGNSPLPTLSISNTIIKNMSVAALYGRGTFIKGWNCVFANCQQYAGAFTLGGKYDFYHCTFANYWGGGNRKFSCLLLNNYYLVNKDTIHRPLDSAYFYNCIVYGDISSGDEIELDRNNKVAFKYKFHNCLLKTTLNTSSSSEYINPIINKEPYFTNVNGGDYSIRNPFAFDALIDKGDPSISNLYPIDIIGNSRITNQPGDLGAYEYKPF